VTNGRLIAVCVSGFHAAETIDDDEVGPGGHRTRQPRRNVGKPPGIEPAAGGISW
jgi:hypothetical protein